MKSQNARDDARRETKVEAALLVQGGESTPLPPPQLTGDSKTIIQLRKDLGEAHTQITKLEEVTVQLQESLKKQSERISSNTTQIARLYNSMDYRIQGKIMPRILDVEEYLQKLTELESKVITTAPLDQDSLNTLPRSPPMSLPPGTRTPLLSRLQRLSRP